MKNTKKSTLKILTPAIAAICLGLVPHGAKAGILYFDPNAASPVTAGTYTWDTTTLEWSTSASLSGSPVAWVQGDAAVFAAGSFTGNITLDVNSTIDLAGFFDGNLGPPGCNVILANPNNSGSFLMAAGAQALGVGGSNGGGVTMEVPMTDLGGANASTPESEEDAVNTLYLYAPNTTSGGFILGPNTFSGNANADAGVAINNGQAFGTGTISDSSTSMREIYTPLAAQTGGINIGNKFQLWNGVLEFAGVSSAPITLSGNLALSATAGQTSTLQIQSTHDVGAGNTTVTVTGGITGVGNLAKTGVGTLVLKGGSGNTYTGSTTVSAGTLLLNDANEIANTSGLILNGGRLDPNDQNQTLGTLSLGGNSGVTSYIDFEAGDFVTLDFSDSHLATWQSNTILDLVNYDGGVSSAPSAWNGSGDILNFGDQTGLTVGALGKIEFNSDPSTLGEAALDSSGNLIQLDAPVPEPSSIALGLLGGLGVFVMRRKKA